MNQKPLTVSEYQPSAHRAALVSFMSGAYAPDVLERRTRVLDWIHDHHPLRERTPLRHIILDGTKVAGTMGHLPADFAVNGSVVPARFTHDLLVDPSYRGQGLAKMLVERALAANEFMPGGMWMTGPCYKLHQTNGFDDAKPLVTRTLVLDPAAFVARKEFAGVKGLATRAALSVLRAKTLSRARRLAVSSTCTMVEQMDPALDARWRELLSGFKVGLVRNAATINWKYAHHPVLRYRLCVAMRDGTAVGYLIWRLSPEGSAEKRAAIVDFLVEKGDRRTLELMAARAIVDAADAGMEVVSFLTAQSWAGSMFQNLGFLPRGEAHTWLIAGWKGRVPAEWLADHDPWHICMGDSDGDMWTGSV